MSGAAKPRHVNNSVDINQHIGLTLWWDIDENTPVAHFMSPLRLEKFIFTLGEMMVLIIQTEI